MKPRMLYILGRLPQQPLSGSELVHMAFARHCSRYFDVDLAGTFPEDMRHSEQSDAASVVHAVHGVEYDRNWSLAVRVMNRVGLGSPELWQGWDCPSMHRLLSSLVRRNQYDIAVIDLPYLCGGKWSRYTKGLPVLHVVHDVLEDIAAATEGRSAFEVRSVARRERASWAAADSCWAFIEANAARVSRHCKKVVLSPLGIDAPDLRHNSTIPKNRNMLFVGSLGYAPNAKGIEWFVAEVLPRVRQAHSDAQLTVIGKGRLPGSVIKGIEGVSVHSDVPSVAEYYQFSRLVIVPLPYGSGFRVKVVEAMSMGRPIVSTTVGCEGIGLEHGRNGLLADDARSFAECVISLLEDDDLCAQLAGNAASLARERFTWDKALEPVIQECLLLAEREPRHV